MPPDDETQAQDTETQSQETQSQETQESHESQDVIEAPEGEFPKDAKGFDGTPVEQILKEREERLDPDNRPENTEVSNAGREFDVEKGMFTDEEGYEQAEEQYTAEEP